MEILINEPTPGHAPSSVAEKAFGDDWITRSYEIARQYCPNAVLIVNDYNILKWDTDKFIETVTPAIASGYVDAIGVEAHGMTLNYLNGAEELPNTLDRIAALGLPIYISENEAESTDDAGQLAMMQEYFPLLYTHPSVRGITYWGHLEKRHRPHKAGRNPQARHGVVDELSQPGLVPAVKECRVPPSRRTSAGS